MSKTAVTVFTSQEFGDICVIGTPDDPKFCLADVCKVLELDASQVMKRLDKEVVTIHPLQTAGGTQNANFVNEDGLYDVILDSRKPEAKRFRKWITSEILPSIRKTGSYSVNSSGNSSVNNKNLCDTLLRFAEATTLLDPTVRKKSFEVFLGTLLVEHPCSEEDHTCRAKNPEIKTITMQELYDNYVVTAGIKVVPTKDGSLIPVSVSSLHNYVIRSCHFALPQVINPPIKYLRRNRLVNIEKVDDIIQTLKAHQLRHERSFVS